ncbi:HpcH/HpaI aldolase/citrate lyase family protein [Jiella sp. M17.18]|uniref:HpcH/HpaI aldolase family protein n=1 Tax=Jiella sp. M17.18 TaxID=3234247 RepID=UPI0034DE93D4
MPLPALRQRLQNGAPVSSSWIGGTDPLIHEAFLRADFDAITFDVQHGLLDETSLKLGIERAAFLGRPALVRLPIEDLSLAARTLDWGASGVILPMVEAVEDAARLVAATKYPPLGQRSYGPTRTGVLHGYEDRDDYVVDARNETFAFAMIETAAALEALNDILALDGLDGVFVGPSDLSIALAGDGTRSPRGEKTESAVRRVSEAAASAGKISGIYAATPQDAAHYRSLGFRLICIGSDLGTIQAAANALAKAARE